MSTINVNYMTRTYNQFLNNQQVRTPSNKSMADTIADKLAGNEKTEDVGSTAKTGVVSTKDMTMEEYKVYISNRISGLSIHPSRTLQSFAVNISEAGFEAMKNDPEYEEWVLGYLEKDFMISDPWTSVCGGSYVVYNFGTSKEEFHAEGWYAGYQNNHEKSLYESKTENSFWERRIENKKRLEKQIEKKQEQKRIREEMEEQAAYEEYILQKMVRDADEVSINLSTVSDTKPTVTSSQAVSSYEASFVVTEDSVSSLRG